MILSPECIHIGCFGQKNGNIIYTAFPIQYYGNKVYQDPGKGKTIADSVITTTPIFITLLSILNLLSIYRNGRKFVG